MLYQSALETLHAEVLYKSTIFIFYLYPLVSRPCHKLQPEVSVLICVEQTFNDIAVDHTSPTTCCTSVTHLHMTLFIFFIYRPSNHGRPSAAAAPPRPIYISHSSFSLSTVPVIMEG